MRKSVVVLWLVTRAGLVHADDKVTSPAPLPSAPQCELPGVSSTDSKNPAFQWCKNPVDESDAVDICVDAMTGCIVAINNGLADQKAGFLIPPNRAVIVTVHAPGDAQDDIADVSVNLAGSVGLVLPATYGDTKDMLGGNALWRAIVAVEPACVPKPRSYVARFAPRGAGAVPLTITIVKDRATVQKSCASTDKPSSKSEHQQSSDALPIDGSDGQPDRTHATEPADHDDAKAKPATEDNKDKQTLKFVNLFDNSSAPRPVDCHWALCAVNVTPPPPPEKPPSGGSTPPKGRVFSYEFYVPRAFGGALRIGFGAIHVEGLAHAYGVRKVVGSDFSQIVDGGADPVSAELVIGYAPFLFAKASAAGGRTYTSDENAWARVAPYFGVGVLSSSPSASKAEFLRSFYLGLEYELTPGSSIAIVGVLRRVDALASGLNVGMTVDSTTNISRTTFDLGWGLVFNVTPGFFQFAASALPK